MARSFMTAQKLSAENWQAIFRYATEDHRTLPRCIPVYNRIRLVSSYFNLCIRDDPYMWTAYEFQLGNKFENRPGSSIRFHTVLYVLWDDRNWQMCINRSGSLSLDIKIHLGDIVCCPSFSLVTPIFELLSRCHSFSYYGCGSVWEEIAHRLHNSKTLEAMDLQRRWFIRDLSWRGHTVLPKLTTLRMHSRLTVTPLIRAQNLRCLELHDIELDLQDAQLAFKWMPRVRVLTVDHVKVEYLLQRLSAGNTWDKLVGVHFPFLHTLRFVAVEGILYREAQAELFCKIVASNPTLRAIQIRYTPQLFRIISGMEVSNLRWLAAPMLELVGISGHHFYRVTGGRPALKKSITNLKNALATYQTNVQRIRLGHFHIDKSELESLEAASQPIIVECVKCRMLVQS